MDWMDVLVMQIKGSKEWKYFDPCAHLAFNSRRDDEHSLRASGCNDTRLSDLCVEYGTSVMMIKPNLSDECVNAHFKTLTLHPGELLYLPRGVLHHASTLSQSSESLHLTLGIETSAAFSLVHVATTLLTLDPVCPVIYHAQRHDAHLFDGDAVNSNAADVISAALQFIARENHYGAVLRMPISDYSVEGLTVIRMRIEELVSRPFPVGLFIDYLNRERRLWLCHSTDAIGWSLMIVDTSASPPPHLT